MSLFSDCDNEFSRESVATSAPAPCQIMEFIFFFLPNFGVVSGAHLHMAGVKMFASLSYFIVSSAYIFLRKNRMFPACYTEIVKFNFTLIFTLFLSHTVTHTQEHKSLGAQ